MPILTPYRGDSSQLLLFKIASCLSDGSGVLTVAEGDARYVLKAGDTMTGRLTINDPTVPFRSIVTDAGTANSPFIGEFYHRTSGVPIAGFGSRIQFYATATNANDQFQCRIDSQWIDPTAQTSRMVFGLRNTGGVISTNLILTPNQCAFPTGTALLPSACFISDTTTGFYLAGTTNIGVAVGGVNIASLRAGGITVTSGIQTGASIPVLSRTQVWNNAATTFTAELLNVTNTAAATGSLLFNYQIDSSDRLSLAENGQLVATRQNLTNSAMALSLRKRGNNVSATGVNLNNGAIGNIVFQGWTGAAFVTGGSLATVVEGDWSGSNTGMSIQFQVTANGVFNNPANILNLSGVNGITFQRSVKFPYVAKTATYTATEVDYTINCTANSFTINLPTAVGISGREYVIKNSGAGVITIDPSGAQTIDGLATQNVVAGASATIQSDGANWIIV